MSRTAKFGKSALVLLVFSRPYARAGEPAFWECAQIEAPERANTECVSRAQAIANCETEQRAQSFPSKLSLAVDVEKRLQCDARDRPLMRWASPASDFSR